MNKFFIVALGAAALFLASIAAYISIYGLSKVFIGAATLIIVMMSILEFSKVLIVSLLHQRWNRINKKLRGFLMFATIVLMLITSIGVYGFLSSAYSNASVKIGWVSGEITLLDKKIQIKKDGQSRLNEQINIKNNRISTLTELRRSQETRLDSLYQRGWIASAKKTEAVIKDADNNIDVLVSKSIVSINDLPQPVQLKLLKRKNLRTQGAFNIGTNDLIKL